MISSLFLVVVWNGLAGDGVELLRHGDVLVLLCVDVVDGVAGKRDLV